MNSTFQRFKPSHVCISMNRRQLYFFLNMSKVHHVIQYKQKYLVFLLVVPIWKHLLCDHLFKIVRIFFTENCIENSCNVWVAYQINMVASGMKSPQHQQWSSRISLLNECTCKGGGGEYFALYELPHNHHVYRSLHHWFLPHIRHPCYSTDMLQEGRDMFHKVRGPYVVTLLNHITIFEWWV